MLVVLEENGCQAPRFDYIDRPTAQNLSAQLYPIATCLLPAATAAGQSARPSIPGNAQVVFLDSLLEGASCSPPLSAALHTSTRSVRCALNDTMNASLLA